MQLLHVAPILLRRWWLLLLFAAIGVGVANFLHGKPAAQYESAVTLTLNPAGRSALLPFTGEGPRQSTDIPTLAASYAELLRSRAFGKVVVEQLKVDMAPEDVAGSISARLVLNTNILRLSVTADNPLRAQQVAQGVAEAFVTENVRRQQAEWGPQTRLEEMELLARARKDHIDALRQRRDELYSSIQAGDERQLRELNETESRLDSLEGSYSTLLVEINRTRTSLNTASILDDASPAVTKPPPPRWRSLLSGLAAGLAAAAALAFALEQLGNRARTPEDVAAVAGTGPLAVVGRISARKWPKAARDSRLATVHAPQSAGAEAFRTLRTYVRFAAPEQKLRALLVTSPGAAEGKSFVATNLAVAFAQAGQRVVLVDADLRRPTIHKVFGVSNDSGLMSALVQDLDAFGGSRSPAAGEVRAAAITGAVPSGVNNLWLLPSGPVAQNPDVVLGSKSMDHLLEQLRDLWDLVIIDSAPVGPVADALLMAQRAEGVLMVARADRTRRSALQAALESLAQTSSPVLGVVLNDFRPSLLARLGWEEHYYYYYGKYRYAEAESAEGRTARPAAPARAQPQRPGSSAGA